MSEPVQGRAMSEPVQGRAMSAIPIVAASSDFDSQPDTDQTIGDERPSANLGKADRRGRSSGVVHGYAVEFRRSISHTLSEWRRRPEQKSSDGEKNRSPPIADREVCDKQELRDVQNHAFRLSRKRNLSPLRRSRYGIAPHQKRRPDPLIEARGSPLSPLPVAPHVLLALYDQRSAPLPAWRGSCA
jgi:hypothetical protein